MKTQALQRIESVQLDALNALTSPDLTEKFEASSGKIARIRITGSIFQEREDAENSEIIERPSCLYSQRPNG
jgi:hypothetical protein